MVSKSFWTVSCPLVKLQTSHFLFLHVTVEDSDGADSWVRGRSDVVWCCFHPFYPAATKTWLFLFFSGGWQPALADLLKQMLWRPWTERVEQILWSWLVNSCHMNLQCVCSIILRLFSSRPKKQARSIDGFTFEFTCAKDATSGRPLTKVK